MTVGQKLEKWRRAQGLNQRQAAARAKVSQAAWQAVEADRCKRLGLDVARKIAASTGGAITLDDFARRPRPSPQSKRTGTDG